MPLQVVSGALAPEDPRRGAMMALGNFDGFHRGHLYLLQTTRDLAAGRPFAAMSCEPHPVQAFRPETGRYRLASPRQKAWRAAELGLSYLWQPAFTPAFAALAPEAFLEELLIRDLGVSGLVVGEDFRFGKDRRGDLPFLREACLRLGLELKVLAKLGGYSSTAVRQALRAGDLAQAEALLGRPWHVEIRFAAEGAQIEPSQVLPPPGRYLLRCRRSGEKGHALLDAEGGLTGLPPSGQACASWAILRREPH